MKNLTRLLGRRILVSLTTAVVFFLILLSLFKMLHSYSIERQSVKNLVAKSVIGCLHAKVQNPNVNCQSVLENMEQEVPEVRFQVWVLDSNNTLLWKNTDVATPALDQAFLSSGSVYTPLEKRRPVQIKLSVPNGFVDDAMSKARVVVGDPLVGNNYRYLRNRVLAYVFALFILGVILSSAISFRMLSTRATEAKRILKSLREGDFTARFKAKRLDELSELSSSFNQMVDLLANSLQKVKESEESRRLLVGELSHDLRTPLTSMTSFLQLLQGPNVSESLKAECLSSLSAEINYLNQLVSSLFELSQIESPQTKADRVPLDLTSVLREIENDFALSTQVGPVKFSAKLPEKPLFILGDRVLARRMLSNLIDNSVRHAKSWVKLTAVTVRDPDRVEGPSFLKLEITDDGNGFSESALMTFGKPSTTRSADFASSDVIHLGLGSVIASKIAKLHEGKIVIENQAEGGARIMLRFKLQDQNVE